MNEVVKKGFGSSLQRTVDGLLQLNRFANRFKSTERGIEFEGLKLGGKERDAEHTWQVIFIGRRMIYRKRLTFDPLSFCDMAMYHDLVEVPKGDTPMFPDRYLGEPAPDPALKKNAEEEAYRWLESEYGDSDPDMIKVIREYLDQETPLSHFVHALNKLIAVMNIYQDKGRSWLIRGIPIDEAYRRHVDGASKDSRVKEWFQRIFEFVREDATQFPNLYPNEPRPLALEEEARRRSE
jgi:5'-deoxynucleotidase YfbR-like HD superfamily hydrolase